MSRKRRREQRPAVTAKQIEAAFHDAWEEFGDDTSTGFLIAIVSDRLGVDHEQVVDALVEEHGDDE